MQFDFPAWYARNVKPEGFGFKTKFWALMVLAAPILGAVWVAMKIEQWNAEENREAEMDDWAREAEHDG